MTKTSKKPVRRLRVLVLFEVHDPPAPDEEYDRRMKEEPDWRTEGHVVSALRELGHEVHLGAIWKNPREIIDLVERIQPDLVWNFVQTFHGSRYYESNVAGVLELCRVRYTGCGHRALMICQDKALAKKILKHHRVPVAPFVVSHLERPLKKLSKSIFPVIVKPLAEEGSVGISRDSFAESEEQALARIAFLHERRKQDVIVEHYVEGREIYVGVVGNERLTVLPPRELKFTKVPEGEPKFASFKAKWDDDYRERWGILNAFADDLPEPLLRALRVMARRVFRVLQMRGYGRIDMRLTDDGRLYVVEANPNPEIAKGEDVAEAARATGTGYPELIERIAALGLSTSLP
jgi:D-alanine-D-alanine ligase